MHRNNTGIGRPEYYEQCPWDMMHITDYVVLNCHHEKMAPSREFAIGNIIKYIFRLGLKDDVKATLFKIENYAHFARTGQWIGKEKMK